MARRDNFMPRFIDTYTEDRMLEFFNAVLSAEEIDGLEPQEGPVFDHPGTGYSRGRKGYDIGLTVAEYILSERARLGGNFTSISQVAGLDGVGRDKIYDLIYTFGPRNYRPSALSLDDAQWTKFKNAVQVLIDDGFYARFASIHSFMDEFMMHGFSDTGSEHGEHAGNAGQQRFLPWHRAYLHVFEEALRQVDSDVSLPFWDWVNQREIPPQMLDFTGLNTLPREPGLGLSLPTARQLEKIMDNTTYTDFTSDLEEGPHNFVHTWVRGDMLDPSISTNDPLFWMHHANVDRYWHYWQQWNPAEEPDVSGADFIMTPWDGLLDERFMEMGETLYNFDADSVRHCAEMGYTYPALPIKVPLEIYRAA